MWVNLSQSWGKRLGTLRIGGKRQQFPQHWLTFTHILKGNRCDADEPCERGTQVDHDWCWPPCPPMLLRFTHIFLGYRNGEAGVLM